MREEPREKHIWIVWWASDYYWQVQWWRLDWVQTVLSNQRFYGYRQKNIHSRAYGSYVLPITLTLAFINIRLRSYTVYVNAAWQWFMSLINNMSSFTENSHQRYVKQWRFTCKGNFLLNGLTKMQVGRKRWNCETKIEKQRRKKCQAACCSGSRFIRDCERQKRKEKVCSPCSSALWACFYNP